MVYPHAGGHARVDVLLSAGQEQVQKRAEGPVPGEQRPSPFLGNAQSGFILTGGRASVFRYASADRPAVSLGTVGELYSMIAPSQITVVR